MDDRELLERAAKAAGITLAWSSVEGPSPRNTTTWDAWNPLTDDGDALRLAVKLRLCLIPLAGGGWDVERYNEHGEGMTVATCASGAESALRDCIVRAAASLPL